MNDSTSLCKHCEGKHIYLREICQADVNERYCCWMNDNEVTQFMESRFTPQSHETIKNFIESILGSPNYVFLAIIVKDGEQHIGNIKVGPIDWNHSRADVGILIGEKSAWGKGYATEAIKLIVKCCFEDLKLHKLTAGAYASNKGSIRAFTKAGFKQEGILMEHYIIKNIYENKVCLGLINNTEGLEIAAKKRGSEV